MEMYFCPLYSGSSGNALFCQYGNTRLLIDAGKTGSCLTAALQKIRVDPETISGVLITHEHSDHIQGAGVIARKYHLPLYATQETWRAMEGKLGKIPGDLIRTVQSGKGFWLGDIGVEPFSIPHDAADPVGYLFDDGVSALFVGTDMGAPTFGVRDALARATCAVLESNHDPVLLQTSDRPVSLKQRIAGRCGHLSNGDAADLVREVCPQRLRTLLLAHISKQCNAPYLALETMRSAVAELGRPVALEVLYQDAPSPLYEF